MGFLSKIFKRKSDKHTPLEQYLDKLSPSLLGETVKNTKETMKVPLSQALSVLLFSKSFTDSLRGAIQELNSSPLFDTSKNIPSFPYDKILTECASFHFFILMQEYASPDTDEDEWDDGEEDNHPSWEKEDDAYVDSLETAMLACGRLIHQFTDGSIPDQFIWNRARAYRDANKKAGDVIDKFQNFLFGYLYPNWDGSPIIDLNATQVSMWIMNHVVTIPIDSIRDSCRGLYEEHIRNPGVF